MTDSSNSEFGERGEHMGWVVLESGKHKQLYDHIQSTPDLNGQAAPLPVVLFYPNGQEQVMDSHANLFMQANEADIKKNSDPRGEYRASVLTPSRQDVVDNSGVKQGTMISFLVETGPDDYQFLRHQRKGIDQLKREILAVNTVATGKKLSIPVIPTLVDVPDAKLRKPL